MEDATIDIKDTQNANQKVQYEKEMDNISKDIIFEYKDCTKRNENILKSLEKKYKIKKTMWGWLAIFGIEVGEKERAKIKEIKEREASMSGLFIEKMLYSSNLKGLFEDCDETIIDARFRLEKKLLDDYKENKIRIEREIDNATKVKATDVIGYKRKIKEKFEKIEKLEKEKNNLFEETLCHLYTPGSYGLKLGKDVNSPIKRVVENPLDRPPVVSVKKGNPEVTRGNDVKIVRNKENTKTIIRFLKETNKDEELFNYFKKLGLKCEKED